jgi:hypothetical protein
MARRSPPWNLVIVALAIGAGLGLSYRPWAAYVDQREKADRHIAEMREAEHRREDLLRQKARYEPPLGREELARSKGYVKADEIPVPEGGR